VLAKAPGVTLVAVVCLALGIGVNSAIFSIVDTIAIKALPFRDPDGLVSLGTHREGSNDGDLGGLSPPDYRDWRERTHSFSEMGAISSRDYSVSDGGEAERLSGALVTASLFPMLGMQPIAGRSFSDDDDRAGGAAVALLSHGLWQRRYASDPSIVGRRIFVDTVPTVVVGVMPPRFQFPEQAELWLPAGPATAKTSRAARELTVLGRRKPGVSLQAAREDVVAVEKQLVAQFPENQKLTGAAKAMRDELVPEDVRLIVYTMMGAVTFVLLIACGNVANLLLARATARQREIAVRAALGAGRGRIVRQLLTESVVIALLSTPLGIAIAYVGLRWLTASVPPGQVPYYIDWSMNPRVVVYTAAIAIATGVVFGLAPALQATRGDLHGSLKEGRGSAGGFRNRLRSGLVVLEVALSLVVLVGASLFVRTFVNFERARAGVPTGGLMTLRFFMAGDAYATPDPMIRRIDDIMRRVEALPGVTSVTASQMMPYSGGMSGGRAIPDGSTVTVDRAPQITFAGVTPQLLRTLNQPLVSGRDFTGAEGASRSGVAIVNQVLAKQLWPDRADVVGLRFRLATGLTQPETFTVIGTVGDFRLFTVRQGKPSPYAFLPLPYAPRRDTGLTIRVAGAAPASITSAVREQIRQSDPTLAIFEAKTGDQARADTYWEYGLYSSMFSIFGIVAVLLASVGVYGVLSYAVSQRQQEIGVRMALGATRGSVFRLIVGDGTRLAIAGILFGLVAAAGVTQIIKSFLYNVSPTDPVSFIATATLLVVVAVAASYVPARRATAVDPMIALRAE